MHIPCDHPNIAIAYMQPYSIQQINLAYDIQEDRLLLRTGMSNAEEVRIWITYRIARQMFATLNQEAGLPVAPATEMSSADRLPEAPNPLDAVKQFGQEAAAVKSLEQLDFETGYQERTTSLHNEPLLVNAIDFETEHTTAGQRLCLMRMRCSRQLNVDMRLTKELVLALSRMLLLASKEAAWTLQNQREPEKISSILLQSSTEKQVLH